MVKIFELTNILYFELNENKLIEDFKINIKLDLELEIYIKTDFPETLDLSVYSNSGVSFVVLTPEEIADDPLYQYIFSNDYPKLNTGLVWRLDFDSINPIKEKPARIVTFYSYKGGMGRTTTLYFYAIHLAINEGRKVVIIDCDLEAPGYLNMFNLYGQQNKNGLVEYILDKQFTNEVDLSDYTFDKEISSKYHESGKIYLVPAGNLNYSSDFLAGNEITNKFRTHQDHYIQGLARINIAQTEEMVSHFKCLFNELADKYQLNQNDYILIDSRTGFNDVFGITALSLADLVVAFFGSSEQSKPGIFFLLDEFQRIKDKNIIPPELILVNSLLPEDESVKSEFHNRFVQILNEYTNNNFIGTAKDDDFELTYKFYPLSRNNIAEEIGLNINNNQDSIKDLKINQLIKLIKTQKYVKSTYEILEKFEVVDGKMINLFKLVEKEVNYTDYKNLFFGLSNVFSKKNDMNFSEYEISHLRNTILKSLKKNLPDLFAENTVIASNKFFYRKCMFEIFNRDKFIISGFKGTGKTYLYMALGSDEEIRMQLLEKSGRKGNFEFVNIISLRTEGIHKKFPFDSNSISTVNITNLWLVYTWASIMVDIRDKTNFRIKEYRSTLPSLVDKVKEADTDNSRKEFFHILASNHINEIEKDLKNLNLFLKEHNINLYLLYDQLDRLINFGDQGILSNLNEFEKVVSPLINYWSERYNYEIYSNIFPKIFIRTDLFGKRIKKINNFNAIKEYNTISLEWRPDEIYSFFFKLVFTSEYNISAFFEIMRKYNDYDSTLINEIEEKLKSNDNQIPEEKNIIEPLLNTFFGNEVMAITSKSKKIARETNTIDTGESKGSPYDYFYRNLSNANRTISLRPFIFLLRGGTQSNAWSGAVDLALDDRTLKPLINSLHITNRTVRDYTTKEHLDDLVKESGENILKIITFLQRDESKKYRIIPLPVEDLIDLLTKLIREDNTLNNVSVDDLMQLMEDNGLITEPHVRPFGKVVYFAEMYKYWLNFSIAKEGTFEGRDVNRKNGKRLIDLGPKELGTMESGYSGTIFSLIDNYGFIEVDNPSGKIFFHSSDLKFLKFDNLNIGLKVTFGFGKLKTGRFGAINIREYK